MSLKKRAWSIFWVGWVVVGIGVELAAIFRSKRGDTLSENTWDVTGVRGTTILPRWLQWTLRSAVAVFLIWLIPHFFFGILG
jgi:hypothetical protein